MDSNRCTCFVIPVFNNKNANEGAESCEKASVLSSLPFSSSSFFCLFLFSFLFFL